MKETKDNPGLSNICSTDEIIKEFALCNLDKLGAEDEQRKKDQDNIRTKVRTLGRGLKKMNELSASLTAQNLSFFSPLKDSGM